MLTNIALNTPEDTYKSASFFALEKPLETMLLPEELGDGNVEGYTLMDGLGLLNTKLKCAQEKFSGSLYSPHRPLRFTFILSGNQSPVSLEGERGGSM